MKYDYSKIRLENKYVELGCDIVLNDEIFDKNGNASGGDGVIYKCSLFAESLAKNIKINGQGHCIKGF